MNFRRRERFPFTLYGLASLLPPFAVPRLTQPRVTTPVHQPSRPGDAHTGRGHPAAGCRAAPSSPPGHLPPLRRCPLPGALPSVSTDQPLARGAPAPPPHQEIASQAQERQQESRRDQGDQGLLRKVLVVPHTPPLKGFYSKLEKKKKPPKRAGSLTNRKHVHLLNRHQALKQCCSSPPC